MGKTDGELYIEGATDIRRRDFDRCPNCGVHSDRIIDYLKLWECQNGGCSVRYFEHE